MNVRNEIKAQIIRAGMTMQEVVDLLSDEYGWSDSVSNSIQKALMQLFQFYNVPNILISLLKVNSKKQNR